LLKNISSSACRAVWGAGCALSDGVANRLVLSSKANTLVKIVVVFVLVMAAPPLLLMIAGRVYARQLHK
jgi:hypothetical protein